MDIRKAEVATHEVRAWGPEARKRTDPSGLAREAVRLMGLRK